jgi:uncharacterized membrane protein YphA (DoxX/SURF4 family)
VPLFPLSGPLEDGSLPILRRFEWVALLALCSAYLEGGLAKAFDFPGAVQEMHRFGIAPAAPAALAVIALEFLAPAMILARRGRWLGALALAAFTLAASVVANAFWDATGAGRSGMTNAFFEHLGLAGAFVLVAFRDIAGDGRGTRGGSPAP